MHIVYTLYNIARIYYFFKYGTTCDRLTIEFVRIQWPSIIIFSIKTNCIQITDNVKNLSTSKVFFVFFKFVA